MKPRIFILEATQLEKELSSITSSLSYDMNSNGVYIDMVTSKALQKLIFLTHASELIKKYNRRVIHVTTNNHTYFTSVNDGVNRLIRSRRSIVPLIEETLSFLLIDDLQGHVYIDVMFIGQNIHLQITGVIN